MNGTFFWGCFVNDCDWRWSSQTSPLCCRPPLWLGLRFLDHYGSPSESFLTFAPYVASSYIIKLAKLVSDCSQISIVHCRVKLFHTESLKVKDIDSSVTGNSDSTTIHKFRPGIVVSASVIELWRLEQNIGWCLLSTTDCAVDSKPVAAFGLCDICSRVRISFCYCLVFHIFPPAALRYLIYLSSYKLVFAMVSQVEE